MRSEIRRRDGAGALLPDDGRFICDAARSEDDRDARSAAKNFQKCYQRLIAVAGPYEQVLKQIVERTATINYENRMTGNGVIVAVESIIEMKTKLRRGDLQPRWKRSSNRRCCSPGSGSRLQRRN
jgi:hypothetical protein